MESKISFFAACLAEQSRLHPAMEPRDAVKLCYQASYGAEHLLSNAAAAEKYLAAELASVEADGSLPLFEPISADVCRINLAPWKAAALPEKWLFNMFASPSKAAGGIEDYFAAVSEAADAGALPFSLRKWNIFLADYLSGGLRPVHHSEAYRGAEKPAYRVVSSEFIPLLPLLEKAAAAEGVFVIAVDGRAAAGKSTLAARLSMITGGGVISMDDFFLPADLRTTDRLEAPGGNVHYERFAHEVLPFLRCGAEFSYRRFDCSRMDYCGETCVASSPVRIVEGAYSHHPEFGSYMDCRVFCSVEPGEQLRRITLRNGEALAKRFAESWIPMEERYFSAFGIENNAHLVLKL